MPFTWRSVVNKFVVLFIALCLQACTNQPETEVSPLISNGVVPVGVFLDLSGPTKSFGQETYQGLKLAIDEFNDRNKDNGVQIKLITKDTKGSIENTRELVVELIEQDKVVALIGEIANQLSLAAAKIAQQRKIPLISPITSNTHLVDIGEYIFTTSRNESEQGTVMARFAINYLNVSHVAIFREMSSEYSSELTNNFKKSFTDLKGKVVAEVLYREGEVEFKNQMKEIVNSKVDAIVMPGYYDEAIGLAKALKSSQLKVNLIGGDIWEQSLAKVKRETPLNGAYFTTHFHPSNQESRTKDFVTSYSTEFGETPKKFAALGFDSGRVLSSVLKGIDDANPVKIQKSLSRIKDFNGVTGEISLDRKKKDRGSGIVLQIKDGKPNFVTTIRKSTSN